jgi:hypothetical protein
MHRELKKYLQVKVPYLLGDLPQDPVLTTSDPRSLSSAAHVEILELLQQQRHQTRQLSPPAVLNAMTLYETARTSLLASHPRRIPPLRDKGV